jgi:hypothetical protein
VRRSTFHDVSAAAVMVGSIVDWAEPDPKKQTFNNTVADCHIYDCLGGRGRLSALSVFLFKSVLYGAFVWARRALNRQKRRFPARAVPREFHGAVSISGPSRLGAVKHH